MTEENEINEKHKYKAQKRKEAFEARKARATEEKGLVIVNTGPGKGKTTASLGLLFRALGQGMRVGVVQFIKGAMRTGEAEMIEKLDLPVEMHTLGEGFTWNTQDRERDMEKARGAWHTAAQLMDDPSYDMVILDELNVVLRYDYLPTDEVLEKLKNKRHMLHVVITGRGARPELIEQADMVSEIKPSKHPYKEQGIKPQPGIEF